MKELEIQFDAVKKWLKEARELALKSTVHYGFIQGWFACYAYENGEEEARRLYLEIFNVPISKIALVGRDCIKR